jgi:ABC-type glycerol-3-phosphate transport system permease component
MSAGAIAARANRQAAADRRQLRLQRTQHFALRAFGWLLLSVVLLIALFPPYFMTITAFHPPSLSFTRTPTLFSTDLTVRAFTDLFEKYPYLTWVSNTTLVSVSSTIFSVTVATLAAYSLSRLRPVSRRRKGLRRHRSRILL